MSKCQKMGSGWLGVPSTLAIFTSPPWLRSLSRASPRHPLKSRPSAPLGKRQLASLVAGDKVRYKCTSSSSFLLNSDGLQPTDDGLHLVAKLLVPILPRRDPGASKPRGLGSNPQSRLTRSFSLSKKRGFERTLHDLCTNPSKFKLGTLLDLCISAPALPPPSLQRISVPRRKHSKSLFRGSAQTPFSCGPTGSQKGCTPSSRRANASTYVPLSGRRPPSSFAPQPPKRSLASTDSRFPPTGNPREVILLPPGVGMLSNRHPLPSALVLTPTQPSFRVF